jgi:hypothetical protein
MTFFKNLALLSFTSLFLIACGKNDGSDNLKKSFESGSTYTSILSPANGNFRLVATDDPFTYGDVAAAKITINKIDVRDTEGKAITVLEKDNDFRFS